ncbi:MAG: thiol oxidoreductase [Betaproteobacteria bacterium]|nr:thiol oxidoreductase [Betaproteobacteria bacterium]
MRRGVQSTRGASWPGSPRSFLGSMGIIEQSVTGGMITEARPLLARRHAIIVFISMAAIALGGCTGSAPTSPRMAGIAVAGTSEYAFQHARPSLDAARLAQFALGKEEFVQRWVPFPSIGGQWGRGPLSNAQSCEECHERNGRGSADPGSLSLVARLAAAGNIPLPDPVYGGQLNTQGILGKVPAEGQILIRWREQRVVLHDGEVVTLRWPETKLSELAYGALSRGTRISLRVAPQLAGLGLLEAVGEHEIERQRIRQRALGAEGRVHRVREGEALVTGRFGWKASQPSLRRQAAAAFRDDIGVTSYLFPAENCTPAQTACVNTQTVAHPELKEEQLDRVTAYLQGIAVPSPRASSVKGARLFAQLQCDACHAPRLRTSLPEAPLISPYTDLMLHDMGEALAAETGELDAQGNEWRTAPLWGLGLLSRIDGEVNLLHDGRARDVQEAILWHGGQALKSREAFARLSRSNRAILLQFLQSL